MQNTQVYSFFLDQGPGNPGIFLFKQKFPVSQRPQVGQVVIKEFTFEEFKIIRDEVPENAQFSIRVTHTGATRVTDDGRTRVTGIPFTVDEVTHNYFITPVNDPNRIISWSSNKFEEDQTLRQLFR